MGLTRSASALLPKGRAEAIKTRLEAQVFQIEDSPRLDDALGIASPRLPATLAPAWETIAAKLRIEGPDVEDEALVEVAQDQSFEEVVASPALELRYDSLKRPPWCPSGKSSLSEYILL